MYIYIYSIDIGTVLLPILLNDLTAFAKAAKPVVVPSSQPATNMPTHMVGCRNHGPF